jgi:hypothetical protein
VSVVESDDPDRRRTASTRSVMSLYELEVGWARTADDRRYLRWELLACDDVRGVFHAAREDALSVLFDGGRREFQDWANTVAPGAVA